ncbi:MAG TPA: xanthine dehydrogenase small subunit [Stellaceae bacterium]
MRDTVRFLLGGERRELHGVDPTMTVLDYLRLVERRCGTKEGCAEGDCGACTVVIGRPSETGGAVRYEAVNACIQFVPMLDGVQLLSVEDLKGPDGALHPVQEALVESNGSQCGFCTPGFVMSLFARYYEPEPAESIDDTLAGNLCRCTGYRSIVAAAERMHETGGGYEDRFARNERETARLLAGLSDEETLCIKRDGRRFLAPATLDALADLLVAHPEARIVAGATDVGLWVTKQLRVLDTMISVGRVAELKQIVETPEAIEIGAGATYTEAAPVIARHYPDFGELIRRLGSVQIRNAGTIGGNVANGSPIGDTLPALIAAGATLHLRRGAERRSLPLEEFFLAYGRQDRRPGEFVERVTLPKPATGTGTRFRAYKVSKRFDQDISAVCGAFSLMLEQDRVAAVRIAYGGMAPTPKRAAEAEAALLGQPWTRATVEAAMAALTRELTPISDMRASAEYRMRVARNLLMRLFVETTDPAAETRLVGERRLAHA